MDKTSYLLAFLIMIAGCIVFSVYFDTPQSYILSACWGLIVAIGAVKIEKYLDLNNGSDNRNIQ